MKQRETFVSVFGLLAAFGVLCLSACAGDPEESEDVEVELCEHMAQGPIQTVTATASPTSASLPNAGFEHTRVDITLPSPGAGYVRFEAAEAGEYVFALGQDVGLAVYRAPGDLVGIESEIVGAMACTEVAHQYYYDLEVGPYILELGPGSPPTTSVSLVSEALGAHSHEDHAD